MNLDVCGHRSMWLVAAILGSSSLCLFFLIFKKFYWFFFPVYSKVIQLSVDRYSFSFRFFSHIGYHIILNRVPCAI